MRVGPATAVVGTGEPAGEILRVARGYRAQLVVLGTRGRSGVARILLGSVARSVLLHSTGAVLIAHAPRRTR